MKRRIKVIGLCLLLLVGCGKVDDLPNSPAPVTETAVEEPLVEETAVIEAAPQVIIPDLTAVTEGLGWKGDINAVTLAEKDGAPAVEFDELIGNIIWLDEFEFTDGTIEFDAIGKSDPPQESFVGVAFRVVNIDTFDAVYFRPFNFRATDPERKSHAVQYISAPLWHWDRLRAEKTGQYEQPIDPAPDGDMWFHARVVIEDQQVSVYVNGASEPSLMVNELSGRSGGSVGIWVYGYGVVSNLQINPKE